MKKIISILLAVILAFSAFSMVSFAEGTEGADLPVDPKDSMTAKWFRDNDMNDFDKMELAVKVTSFFEETASISTVYIKDGKIAIEAPLEFGFLTVNSKIILDIEQRNLSAYCPSFPFFYISFDGIGDYSEDFTQFPIFEDPDLVLEDTYSESGYYVEKMRNLAEDLYNCYYFKDGELVFIETYEFDVKTSSVEILSCDVSDKDVSVPSYAIDLTFIFNLFSLI